MDDYAVRIFGEGCDARLSGRPLASNPYGDDYGRVWRKGWKHVNDFWGIDSRRPVKELPRVSYE